MKYEIYNCEQYHSNNKEIKQIYSHNLDLLIKDYAVPFGLSVPEKIIKNAKIYTAWEAESRYSLGFSVRIDSLKTAIKQTEDWLIKIKPIYQKKLQQVNKRLGFDSM